MRAAVAALTALALVAGCGSDSNDETTPGATALSQAEYIEQADAICQRYRNDQAELGRRFEELTSEGITTENVGEAAALFRELADARRQELRELRLLPPPSGDSEVLGDWLSAIEASVSLGQSLADAYDTLDADRVATLVRELESSEAEAEGIARGYGLEVCGQREG
jgi:hypothetical protein